MNFSKIRPTKDGGIQIEVTPDGNPESVEVCRRMAECFLDILDSNKADNFIEMQMHTKDGRGVVVNLRRIGGMTPSNKLQIVEKERDELLKEVKELRKLKK